MFVSDSPILSAMIELKIDLAIGCMLSKQDGKNRLKYPGNKELKEKNSLFEKLRHNYSPILEFPSLQLLFATSEKQWCE